MIGCFERITNHFPISIRQIDNRLTNNSWCPNYFSLGKSLELDSTKLKFSKYKTGREQLIQSGNLDSLLQRLTTVGYSGMAFINAFLTTFPLFTDAHTIMDFLFNSWKQCSKPQLTQTRSAYTFVNGTHYTIPCYPVFKLLSCIYLNMLFFISFK